MKALGKEELIELVRKIMNVDVIEYPYMTFSVTCISS